MFFVHITVYFQIYSAYHPVKIQKKNIDLRVSQSSYFFDEFLRENSARRD